MKLIDANVAAVTIELTRDELVAINNALNEICNGPGAIEAWEFPIRIGVAKEEAEQLLAEIARV